MFIGIGLGLNQGVGRGGGLNAQLASAAGAQPAISADLKSGQAWVRGAPYAVTSLPGWSFSRALAAYGQTSAGVLQSFASGAPRLVNGRGQLIEGARTNLCLRSQEFDDAAWTKTNVTVTANAGVAPDGTTTADLCTVTSTAATNLVQATSAVTGTNCTASIYVQNVSRTGTNSSFFLRDSTAGVVKVNCSINWDAMTVSGTGASIQRLGSTNWYRIILTDTAWTTTNVAQLYAGATGSSLTGGQAWYPWGAMVEAAAFPSSYIPTTTTSVTRPADIPLIDISAYSPAITYPLTMYARWEPVGVSASSGNQALVSLNDAGGDLGYMYANNNTTVRSFAQTAGATQENISISQATAAGASYRAATRLQADNFQLCVNGTLGTADTSGTAPNSPTTLYLGCANSTELLFGYLSEFAIIPGAVSDANLQRLAA